MSLPKLVRIGPSGSEHCAKWLRSRFGEKIGRKGETSCAFANLADSTTWFVSPLFLGTFTLFKNSGSFAGDQDFRSKSLGVSTPIILKRFGRCIDQPLSAQIDIGTIAHRPWLYLTFDLLFCSAGPNWRLSRSKMAPQMFRTSVLGTNRAAFYFCSHFCATFCAALRLMTSASDDTNRIDNDDGVKFFQCSVNWSKQHPIYIWYAVQIIVVRVNVCHNQQT